MFLSTHAYPGHDYILLSMTESLVLMIAVIIFNAVVASLVVSLKNKYLENNYRISDLSEDKIAVLFLVLVNTTIMLLFIKDGTHNIMHFWPGDFMNAVLLTAIAALGALVTANIFLGTYRFTEAPPEGQQSVKATFNSDDGRLQINPQKPKEWSMGLCDAPIVTKEALRSAARIAIVGAIVFLLMLVLSSFKVSISRTELSCIFGMYLAVDIILAMRLQAILGRRNMDERSFLAKPENMFYYNQQKHLKQRASGKQTFATTDKDKLILLIMLLIGGGITSLILLIIIIGTITSSIGYSIANMSENDNYMPHFLISLVVFYLLFFYGEDVLS
ncbi:MAG: hypothetical protein J7K00_03065 [Candidatus Diapherotrites archaeon]|nr:hypothetical protein [Candidatus Diapherotrites archaeon]